MGFLANQKRALGISKFNKVYPELRFKLVQMLSALAGGGILQKTTKTIKPDEMETFCFLCPTYLLCQDHEHQAATMNEPFKLYATAMLPRRFVGAAERVFELAAIKPYVIALLEYKDERLTALLGDEWTDTPEAARVRARLAKDGKIDNDELYKEYINYKELMTKL